MSEKDHKPIPPTSLPVNNKGLNKQPELNKREPLNKQPELNKREPLNKPISR